MGKLTPKSILYRLVSKRLKKVICVSNSCLNDYIFKNSIKNKSEILHNIISVERLYQKESLDKNKYDYEICYLGRLSEIKNPMRALEIMRDTIQKRPETKCVFIGDGELREACENFVKENNLTNNITFLGFVSNPYKIVKSSRVLLMSSINEGTPMALLESFALGIPLVSSRVDGAVELVKDDLMGYLYDTNEEAVEKILKIVNSDKKKYVDYLTKYSTDYNDIEKYKDQILKAYK
jgi:glycosyltransferase involved in cell wall biosynthesis